MIINSSDEDLHDDESFDDYAEGYDDGFAAAVECFKVLKQMTDKQLEDVFGSSDIIKLMSDPDFECNFDSIIFNHIFDSGEILIDKKTGVKYMCIRDHVNDGDDEFSLNIVVTDHHFGVSDRCRFDFAHFTN